MNVLSLVQVTPPSNPDHNIVKCVVSGNYVLGTADPLPLNNIADPGAIGQVPMPPVGSNPPPVTPSVLNASAGIYQPQVVRILTNGVTSFGLRWYSGGAELATGAFPAGITGAEIFIDITVNLTTQS